MRCLHFAGCSLCPHPDWRLVELRCNAEAGIHKHREDGVHGADVVQHVAVLQHYAAEDDQEVEPPHHLTEPAAQQAQRRSAGSMDALHDIKLQQP
jgi:hypothetical protein